MPYKEGDEICHSAHSIVRRKETPPAADSDSRYFCPPIKQWARWALSRRAGHADSPACVILEKRLACSFAYYMLRVLNLGSIAPSKASAPYNCTPREQIRWPEAEQSLRVIVKQG